MSDSRMDLSMEMGRIIMQCLCLCPHGKVERKQESERMRRKGKGREEDTLPVSVRKQSRDTIRAWPSTANSLASDSNKRASSKSNSKSTQSSRSLQTTQSLSLTPALTQDPYKNHWSKGLYPQFIHHLVSSSVARALYQSMTKARRRLGRTSLCWIGRFWENLNWRLLRRIAVCIQGAWRRWWNENWA